MINFYDGKIPFKSPSGHMEGEYRFLCTADVESFRALGTRFLQLPLGDVEHVDIAEAPTVVLDLPEVRA